MIERAIWLDMDGNFVDLYGVENWLDDLISYNPRPYIVAKPLVNLSALARTLNRLQKFGYTINIVSWLARHSTKEYDQQVTKAKRQWLNKHLPSVKFDRIEILPYGTPKSDVGTGFLFDDEERNRNEWGGIAFSEKELLSELKKLALFVQLDEGKSLDKLKLLCYTIYRVKEGRALAMKLSSSLLRRVENLLQEIDTNKVYTEEMDAQFLAVAHKLHAHLRIGATRYCLLFPNKPVVIKIPNLWMLTSCDYCALELNHYQVARDFGVAEVLLPIKFYKELRNGVKMYLQPKYDFSVQDAEFYNKVPISQSLYENGRNSISYDESFCATYDGVESKKWFACMYTRYGKNFCYRFADWTCECCVNDLHDGNIGFLNNKPIILDYAGFGSKSEHDYYSSW